MTQNEIQRLINIAQTFAGYAEAPKADFHRLAKKYLKEIAEAMRLEPGDFEIRSNKAGIACLGEVTLHSNNLYVQLGGSLPNTQFYYRTVKGKKDYTGGRNIWMDYERLLDPYSVAQTFTRHLDTHRYEWAS